MTKLERSIEKFNKSQKDLAKLLGQSHFDKEGVGYNANKKAPKPKVMQSHMYAPRKHVVVEKKKNEKGGLLNVPNAFHRNPPRKPNVHRKNVIRKNGNADR